MKIDEFLEQYDIDSIQKSTKITKENLRKILAKDFANLNKAQVFGFLSILEREYGAIEDLMQSAQEYFADIEESEKLALSIEPNRSFSISMKPKKAFDSQLIFVVIGFLVLLFVAFMAFDSDSKDGMQVPKMTVDINDTNVTSDINSSDTNSTIKNEANTTSSNVKQNMTMPIEKQSPNKTIEDQTIDNSYGSDDNKSKIITKKRSTSSLRNNKIKTNHNNHKRDYIKVEESNKSNEGNL
ncbi:MAG: hypothetical protein IE880_03685 [Epsilonproteobacteria bacterium]|nr:hypothetical protein [Campylobacterota bacterium]